MPNSYPIESDTFNQSVLNWFDQHGRKHLPWQLNKTPYRVWVSEIMLQQTQVATVIPYYERFMARFPTVESLAQAQQDDVLHLWTGLGYYARGRNLHACARRVVDEFNGHFPATLEQLSDLPGIGRSTAGAILSLSMNQRAAILDGNVKRVLTRVFAVEGWPGTTKVQKELWQIAENLTPEQRFADYTQAMMDLGATLCTRSKPQCGICPVAPGCAGLATGKPQQFPNSKPKKQKPTRDAWVLFIENDDGHVLLQQRPESGIWGGLWSLPQVETEDEIQPWLAQHITTEPLSIILGDSFRHTFSHYHLNIAPAYVRLAEESFIGVNEPRNSYPVTDTLSKPNHWYNIDQPSSVGLPAPIKDLIEKRRALQGRLL